MSTFTEHMKPLEIGVISEGTLRDTDLLQSLGELLQRHAIRPSHTQLAEEALAIADSLETGDIEIEPEKASETLQALFDALDEYAPPYCYVGSIEGDGACIGCFPSIEWLENAVRDGDVIKVSDSAEIPSDYSGEAMIVNDHGNVEFGSVVDGEFYPLWSVV